MSGWRHYSRKIRSRRGTSFRLKKAKSNAADRSVRPTLALEANRGGFELVVDLLGAAEGGLYGVADILLTDDFLELGLMNQAGGLLARGTENENPLRGVALVGHAFNRDE